MPIRARSAAVTTTEGFNAPLRRERSIPVKTCVASVARMSMACEVAGGRLGRSAARKSDAYNLAPVTLGTPSMRPIPLAAGFQLCRPGSVSRAANPGPSALAKRDRLSAIPLAVTNLTNSRREVLMLTSSSAPC